jgi:hypothetical protein
MGGNPKEGRGIGDPPGRAEPAGGAVLVEPRAVTTRARLTDREVTVAGQRAQRSAAPIADRRATTCARRCADRPARVACSAPAASGCSDTARRLAHGRASYWVGTRHLICNQVVAVRFAPRFTLSSV